MQGIDFDDADGTLWGVDGAGNIYHWFPGGAPIGPQPVSAVATPVGLPMVGIAVNESNGAGALAPTSARPRTPATTPWLPMACRSTTP